MNGRNCKICIIDVHRAFYAKHLGSKEQLENEKQNELFYQNGFLKNLLILKSKNSIILHH